MTLVSLDAIVQADATLIVGIVFIVTLKQALRQKVTPGDLVMVAGAILLYVLSGVLAVLPDMYSSLGLVSGLTTVVSMDLLVGMCSFGSMFLFYLGMITTAGAVYWMMRRQETSESEKKK
jgi:hypothetical protein